MKKMIYLLLPFYMLVVTACGDAPDLNEESAAADEELVKNETDKPEKMPAMETAEADFSDVTPEMMVAFKRFREAILNKDAVRLESMIEGKLTDNCTGKEELTATDVIGLLGIGELEVLKKRIETSVTTSSEVANCIFGDHFTVEDGSSFSWAVGCDKVLDGDAGEYAEIFTFRKVNGKFRLVEVMCAG